ncbi:hypothetical protein [Photobacterium indicum]|uniref:hypothetical protein n=1 Tax=Photobacterium indicum TaxID=81447 RepID=UPI003D0E0366
MSKEFNETLSSILKDTHTTTEVASFGELKLLIFKLADLVQFSNELISISEWLELEIEDPLEIKKHINGGVSMYISKYEGLYHVPWLKPLNQIDKPYARMLDKYYAALNNSNDTGVYF